MGCKCWFKCMPTVQYHSIANSDLHLHIQQLTVQYLRMRLDLSCMGCRLGHKFFPLFYIIYPALYL